MIGLLGAGAVYGPEMVQRLRNTTTPAAALPHPSGTPVMVARDSGLSQPQADPPPRPPVEAAPVAVVPQPQAQASPPAPRPAPRPTPPAPRPTVTQSASPARLFVNSTPWGQVYIDGQLVGNTPQANLVVAAGAHRVRVARDGFQPWERAVQLAPGQELRITDISLQALAP